MSRRVVGSAGSHEPVRVGIFWRGEAHDRWPPDDRGLRPLLEALAAREVEVVPVPFGDDRVAAVRERLRGLDGLLVWVNPIQDGATRAQVDDLLREAADGGTWVSAHPDVVAKIGTKEVLFQTRQLGWGTETERYRSVGELASRFPSRLARHGLLVVKQGRGNGGQGVWSVALLTPPTPLGAGSPMAPSLDTPVLVQDARVRDGSSEQLTLAAFLERCAPCFSWSGFVVDQPYQERLGEGLVRCYLSHGEVVGFCHQWPKGLLPAGAASADRPPPVMEGPDGLAYRALRTSVEDEWVPGMTALLGLDSAALPVIWDADFLYGPRDAAGGDTYLLCEINASAVWPFPPMAAPTIAANTLARLHERRLTDASSRRPPRAGDGGGATGR